jgi:hypothetical protein
MNTIELILYGLSWLFVCIGVIFIVYKLEIKYKNKREREKDNE